MAHVFTYTYSLIIKHLIVILIHVGSVARLTFTRMRARLNMSTSESEVHNIYYVEFSSTLMNRFNITAGSRDCRKSRRYMITSRIFRIDCFIEVAPR